MGELVQGFESVPRESSKTRILAMAATMMLAAVSMSWVFTFNRQAGAEFILAAAADRAEGGSGPSIGPAGGRMFMGRQLSPIEAAMSVTTTATAAAQPTRPEVASPNQAVLQGSSAFVGSTFAASHIRALGRAMIAVKPSQDNTRFTNDPRTRHAVAEGIARLADAPLHAITTSLTPLTSSNVGTVAGQDLGSVTVDFTVTFQAEPLAQEGGQPVFPLVHFPKAAAFAHRTKNNNTAIILATFIIAAIGSEIPGVQPFVLQVLDLSLLLFEELSVRKSPGIPSEEPVPSRSDDVSSTSMALVAAGATIMFVLPLVCFGILLWRCRPWRRFVGNQIASEHCNYAAEVPPYPKASLWWLPRSEAERKFRDCALPVDQKKACTHATVKGQMVAAVADKRQPRFIKGQQVLVYSGSQGGWVQGSVHSILADGSVVVRYSKGKRCFEKTVHCRRVDTSIRRPYLRKQKVNVFCEELKAWVPGTIEVAHIDDSLVVLYKKGTTLCRVFVPRMLVQSRIRRVG